VTIVRKVSHKTRQFFGLANDAHVGVTPPELFGYFRQVSVLGKVDRNFEINLTLHVELPDRLVRVIHSKHCLH